MATILVIEDDVEILDMITVVLGTFGHQVVGLSEKVEIDTMVSQYNPQLVLLDVLLRRNFSGREICLIIKKDRPDLPVILMSANPKLLIDYKCCLADDALEKPFNIMELIDKIEKLLLPA